MRKFSIRNSKNEVRALNNERRIMLVNPSGLGFTMERTYNELSDGIFKSSKDGEEQGHFVCDLYFTGSNPYLDYQEFLNWAVPEEKLTIIYSAYDGSVYNCEVQVEYIEKTELDRTGVLICPSSFFCLSPWFSPRNYSFIVDPDLQNASRFDQALFDDGRFTKSATMTLTTIVEAGGHIPGSLLFRFIGEVERPILTLIGRNTGKVYGVCEVDTTLNADETFEYSSDKADSYIRKISGNEIINLEDSIIPGSEAFFSIPITEPCDLIFDGTNRPVGKMSGEIRYYYRSV